MKRIAAPMVGGLLTSAFLTLEIIPVVITYYRHEQLMWERLRPLAPALLRPLRSAATAVGVGVLLAILTVALPIYVAVPAAFYVAAPVATLMVLIAGATLYLVSRPRARDAVWPR